MRRASASQSSETINTRMALAGRDRERKEEGGGHVRGIWGGGKARAKIAKKLATLKRRGEVGGDR